MSTLIRLTTVSALVLTTALVGCARRPALTSTAPAPTAAAASAASPRDGDVIVAEERREIIATARPEPGSFVDNASLRPVYFEFDRYEIRPGDARTLESDAAWLKANDVLVLIEGQCDERGTDEYNIALGDRRARATKAYLVALGIAADRISTISYGKERPVCGEHSEACWGLNRRAHIVIKPRG